LSTGSDIVMKVTPILGRGDVVKTTGGATTNLSIGEDADLCRSPASVLLRIASNLDSKMRHNCLQRMVVSKS